jgi:hypothetical protein
MHLPSAHLNIPTAQPVASLPTLPMTLPPMPPGTEEPMSFRVQAIMPYALYLYEHFTNRKFNLQRVEQ